MKESSKGLPSSGISWTSQESPSSGVTFYQELPSSGFSWSSSQASGGCPVFSQYYFLFCMDIEKKMKVLVAQSCPTLCNPMDYGPPGSSVHGILQGRILEWVVMPFSRGFSQPRDWMWASHTAGRPFTIWATRVALKLWYCNYDILLKYMIWGAKLHSILITKVNPEIDENGKL